MKRNTNTKKSVLKQNNRKWKTDGLRMRTKTGGMKGGEMRDDEEGWER